MVLGGTVSTLEMFVWILNNVSRVFNVPVWKSARDSVNRFG